MALFTEIAVWLSANKTAVSMSTLVGVAGLGLKFLQWRKPPPDPHLRVQSLGRGIAFEVPPGLPFTLRDTRDEQIENVYAIRLRFWNAERRELRSAGQRSAGASDFTVEFSDGVRILGGYSVCSTPDMRFEPVIAAPQTVHVQFDGFNPGEWALLNLMFTGNGREPVRVRGRVLGQSKPYDELFLEAHAVPAERAKSALLLVLPAALVGWGLASSVWMTQHDLWGVFFYPPPSPVPTLVAGGFACGSLVVVLPLFAWLHRWAERRKHPKGFPIDADFEARESENWRAMWLTLRTGRKHRISRSIHDYGKAVVPVRYE